MRNFVSFLSPYFWVLEIKRHITPNIYLKYPVISIGNIELGGTGKTPLVIKIAKYFKKKYNVMVLSRGYKRKFKKPCITNDKLSALECGDEPFMIYKSSGAYVYVNKKREEVINTNLPDNTLFILDDGFQYFKLHRDIDVVIISYKLYKKGGYVIPFGMLREPVSSVKRSHIVIVNFRFSEIQEVQNFMQKKTYSAFYEIDGIFNKEGERVEDIKEAIILSGIAKNKEFLHVVRDKIGINVKKHFFYSDHSYFSEEFLKRIIKYDTPIITTEKDFYRIPENYRKSMFYLKISLKIISEKEFFKTLENMLSHQS